MNKHPSSGSLLFAMVSLFFFFMQAAHAAIYTGVVTDKENNNNPIPGVLVSAGHSIYRTITDAQGRFSFEAPDDAIKTQYAIQKPQLKRNVIWSTRRHSIDLEHSHDITAVAI